MRIAKKCAFFILFFTGILSSTDAQTLRGTVRDLDTGRPVAGSSLNLSGGLAPFTTTSDSLGIFVFENLRPGYYRIDIQSEGFENQTIAELNVVAGKELELEILLLRSLTALPELTVTSNAPGRRQVLPLGEIPLSREQTLRFPATFFDPARLAMTYPGVVNNDDQANGISVRGNSPAFLRWHLEGADIVNPNHLTNAGTISDRPTAAAGGVLMFSAQLLDNSALLTGSSPAGYGDALGGIMDINLRRGNKRHHEFTAQAGLIGIDLAAEGPLFGKGKNSYLVNYRYSTVGLLGQMGISFGDEQIDFQDLSFKLNFQGKKGGEWSLFGLGGLSNNVFEHKTDTAAIEAFKDFFDIDYQSKTGLLGLSNRTPIGQNGWIKLTIAASGQENERFSSSAQFAEYESRDEVAESKISSSLTLSQRFGNHWRLLGGASLTRQFFRYRSLLYTREQPVSEHDYLLAQPWASATWNSLSEKTSVQIGLHSLIFPYKDRTTLEPRLTLTQQLAPGHRLALSGGLYSAVAPLWLPTEALDLLRAWQSGLRYSWNLNPDWTLRGEFFWQEQTNTGVSGAISGAFSLFNENEYRIFDQPNLRYEGVGRNRGLELSAERYFNAGWFALLNATLLKSEYRGSDNTWRDSRWQSPYIVNLTGGKEWQRDKRPGQVRSFGINGRLGWSDGPRSLPVDAATSAAAGYTVFDESKGYAPARRDYFRLDLRVYWKRSFDNRRNSTFAMDFQNATMQENIAYQYWDPYTQQVETKYQLGLIPNLSWRLEF